MQHRKPFPPAFRPGDSNRMKAAVKWLFDNKVRFIRTSFTQLKIGKINFYPDKGTIYIDGDRGPLPQRGFEEFKNLFRTGKGLVGAGITHDPKKPFKGGKRARPFVQNSKPAATSGDTKSAVTDQSVIKLKFADTKAEPEPTPGKIVHDGRPNLNFEANLGPEISHNQQNLKPGKMASFPDNIPPWED